MSSLSGSSARQSSSVSGCRQSASGQSKRRCSTKDTNEQVKAGPEAATTTAAGAGDDDDGDDDFADEDTLVLGAAFGLRPRPRLAAGAAAAAGVDGGSMI